MNSDREQPEALQLADALAKNAAVTWGEVEKAAEILRRLHEENQHLRERLSQPEPEPVAWMNSITNDVFSTHEFAKQGCGFGKEPIPLYAAPPKRGWVELTDDEVKKIVDLNTEDDYGYDI